LGTAPL